MLTILSVVVLVNPIPNEITEQIMARLSDYTRLARITLSDIGL